MTKKIRYFLSFMIMITFFSCININPEYEVPQGEKYIPLKTMEQIIYEIHIADAILTTGVFEAEDKIFTDSLAYDRIFEKYSYTKEQFDQTLLYYSHNHLDSLNIMYEKIMERLSIEKGNNQ